MNENIEMMVEKLEEENEEKGGEIDLPNLTLILTSNLPIYR